MSPNKEAFKFITILSLFDYFVEYYMKCVSAFLYYAASFIIVIAIVFCQSKLFWDCAIGFVNILSVHNDFHSIDNF